MATPDDIENRLTAVERDVAELRAQTAQSITDASAARTLAAGADRDVSEVRAELRAHTSTLNALRETQVEMNRRLGGLESRQDGVEGRLGGLEGRMDSVETTMTQGFATVGAGMTEIVTRLDTLIERNP